MTVQHAFKRITGWDLTLRSTNNLSENIERKDLLFSNLAILCFSNPAQFRVLRKESKPWRDQTNSETVMALLGAISYIAEDYPQAKKYFLKAIALNPDNLDNWTDLAFALRHLGKTKISDCILFHFDYVIYYYKFFKLQRAPYTALRKLILKILKKC
jgi:tetratricopeptide (TPR) repeat protein